MAARSVLVIGGTGAQGVPIVKGKSREAASDNSKLIASLPRVSLYIGPADDEETLRGAFYGIDLAFVNINSAILGIKNEIYWGIRIYQLAVQAGVKHFIWSSLDNFFPGVKYDKDLRIGHYAGKAEVSQWLHGLPQNADTTQWSILTSGPYIELLSEALTPAVDENGVYIFRLPIKDGAMPFVHLDDYGPYVHWIFSNTEKSARFELKVAVEHVSGKHLAETFTKVTGKPARYENVDIEQPFTTGPFAPVANRKMGIETAGNNDKTLITYQQNFSAWFRLYQRSGGNKGILRRDYDLLDKILPQRVHTLEQWMRKVNYTGKPQVVLKVHSKTKREQRL